MIVFTYSMLVEILHVSTNIMEKFRSDGRIKKTTFKAQFRAPLQNLRH